MRPGVAPFRLGMPAYCENLYIALPGSAFNLLAGGTVSEKGGVGLPAQLYRQT